MSSDHRPRSDSYACTKCGSANSSQARNCDACGALLLVKCLKQDCQGRNRPDAAHCSACGTGLDDFRLRRWRELDKLLEQARQSQALGGAGLASALQCLKEVMSEPHAEFQRARDEAREFAAQVEKQENLKRQAMSAAESGNWEDAEHFVNVLGMAHPGRRDLGELAEELRQKKGEALSEGFRAVRDAVDKAHEHFSRGAYRASIQEAEKALHCLPAGHPSEPKIRQLMADSRMANASRWGKILATAVGGILALLTAGHLAYSFQSPVLRFAQEVRDTAEEVSKNLEFSEPPPWVVPDYAERSTRTFRRPPRLPDGIGHGFVRPGDSGRGEMRD